MSKSKHTFRYKHASVNKVRPKLTKGAENKQLPQKAKVRKPIQKDKNAKLRIIPIGGVDAIGKNMTIFECGEHMIMHDAGCMFPDDAQRGIDLILPDYGYVLDNQSKLKAILITHGHEDHIGCLPYLIKDLDKTVPIYGTKLTIGLIKVKFEEHGIKNAQFHEISSGDSTNIGCFQANFFTVNHSIPGGVGIYLQTPAGNILHTGDFKLDTTPIDGEITDFSLISKFAKTGIDVLMSDSTNSLIKEFTPSEAVVGPVLEQIIDRAPGKVIIASFASHIHRIQQVCDAAVACGRKVVVTGRSMIQNTEIARKLGYLHVSDDDIIDAYELSSIPSDEVVVLCTGSQGEPLSALARMACGNHKVISIDEGDTVILSATPVPGNEKAVDSVINDLSKIGVDVYDKTRALVHVSGHGASEELKIMIAMCDPYAFIPVHGEAQHLLAHARLADEVGVDANNIFVCDNGDVIELSTSGVKRCDPVQSGVVFVDGLSVGDTSEDVIDQRSQLSDGGVAVISGAIKGNKVIGSLHVSLLGVSGDENSLHDDLRRTVIGALNKALKKGTDMNHLRKVAKDALLSILWERTNQRPMVVVNLTEV
ncbi:MAG: ribonuclease J [Coriobacteriia bacterium]|nr:ribonuclease J [Coriobacteriia bacterium]